MIRARYFRILGFFGRTLLDLAFWDILLPRLGLRGWSQRTRSRRMSVFGARFRQLAIRLGGVMIKVGQFFSARVDVLPEEITRELAGLQDEVPAEDAAAIRQVVESEFGQPLQEKFLEFEVDPVAAASLGQVHQARIDGRQVVVKVQRPGIESLIATDLAALRTVGGWLQRYRPISRRADVPALIAEFTRILYEEIDYLAEGRNAETFATNFTGRAGVRVPQVVWTHTTRRVLTLEDVRAIKISDYAAITAAGVERARVAERLFQTYLQQIFEDGFFHADPHPGNLFVSPHPPAVPAGPSESEPEAAPAPPDWQLTFVDFGMVGRVPPGLRAGMREMAIAVGTQDAARMVKASQLMGVLLPGADLELLERAEAQAFERFWGKSMSELRDISPEEFHQFAGQFRQLIYDLPFQIPEDLVLLGRTVGILSGMCTGLYPDFNLWQGIAPFAQKLIADEALASRGQWLDELGALARLLLGLPRRMDGLLAKVERGDLAVHDPQLASRLDRLERTASRLVGGLVFSALLLGGLQLYLAGQAAFAWVLLAGAAIALGWVVLVRR